MYSRHNQSLFQQDLEEKKKNKKLLEVKIAKVCPTVGVKKIAPLKDFDGKQEPTTSVQMKVELRKIGKTNLLMMTMIRFIRVMIRFIRVMIRFIRVMMLMVVMTMMMISLSYIIIEK